MSILTNAETYKKWRDQKLKNTITNMNTCVVEINDPQHLTNTEIAKIQHLNAINNFALIQLQKYDNYAAQILSINTALKLTCNDNHLYVDKDTLARITPATNKVQGEFIPYTTKQINWHTDGYYNSLEHRIRSFTLFCVNQAKNGGKNGFLDNDILYILLREKNPELAKLLTRSDAMIIPEHIHNKKLRRKKSVGAIFSIDTTTNSLYMRYTQRKKNIEFSPLVLPAIQELDMILNTQSSYHFSHLMSEGQGIICNNIIHKRDGFTAATNNPRLMLRGRYFTRIS